VPERNQTEEEEESETESSEDESSSTSEEDDDERMKAIVQMMMQETQRKVYYQTKATQAKAAEKAEKDKGHGGTPGVPAKCAGGNPEVSLVQPKKYSGLTPNQIRNEKKKEFRKENERVYGLIHTENKMKFLRQDQDWEHDLVGKHKTKSEDEVICPIDGDPRKGDRERMMVDSGAVRHVGPKELAPSVKMRPPTEKLGLKAAQGSLLQHFGTKDVKFQTDQAHLKFGVEMTNVQKGIMSVPCMVDRDLVVEAVDRSGRNRTARRWTRRP
jgi:hypothetical protein